MAHARQQIRDAVGAALLNNTAAEERVFTSRGDRLDENELPALVILTPLDDTETATKDGQVKHELDLWVICADRADVKAVADRLDDIAVEIETLIGAGVPGIDTKFEELTATEFDQSPEGAEDLALLTMKFRLRYFTVAGAPAVLV